MTVIITRAKGQSGEFAALLEAAGLEVIYFPTIEFKEPADLSVIDSAIANLSSYDWLIFTSANGVSFFFKRLRFFSKDASALKGIKIGVVGPKTASALEKLGVTIDLIPENFQAEGLVKSLLGTDIIGKKILIPRALIGREELPDMLAESGAQVTLAPVYETIAPTGMDISTLLAALNSGKDVVLTFTSGSTVKNFFSAFTKEQIQSFRNKVKIAVISPVTAEVVDEMGFNVDIVPSVYTAKDMAEAIINNFA